eukprot:837080-Amphidinium_carterae.1
MTSTITSATLSPTTTRSSSPGDLTNPTATHCQQQELTAAADDPTNIPLSSKDAETYRTTVGQLLW